MQQSLLDTFCNMFTRLDVLTLTLSGIFLKCTLASCPIDEFKIMLCYHLNFIPTWDEKDKNALQTYSQIRSVFPILSGSDSLIC